MVSPQAVAHDGEDWKRHPIGTGPFMLKEWIPGQHVLLVKNPHYFKPGLPYLDALEFRIMKDPLTVTTALRAGEIDLIARVPMQQVALLERSAGITVVTGPARFSKGWYLPVLHSAGPDVSVPLLRARALQLRLYYGLELKTG